MTYKALRWLQSCKHIKHKQTYGKLLSN